MFPHLKLHEGIVKYTTAAILLIVPLFPKFPFVRIPGTFVSIRLEDLIIFFAAILVFLYFMQKPAFLLKNKIFVAVVLFLGVGLVSLLSGIFITQTVEPHIGLLHWARRVEYLTPMFLGIIAIQNKKADLGFYAKLILIVVTISFVYGFGQKHFSWPVIITQNEEYAKGVALRYVPGGHINAGFAGHYDLATFLVMTLPMIISWGLLVKGKISKTLLLTTAVLGLWLLVNTASRISIVSYLVVITGTLFLIKKYKEILIVIAISLMFVGFSSNLLDRYMRIFSVIKRDYLSVNFTPSVYAQNDALLERRESSPTPTPVPIFEDRSTNIRLNVEWPRAIRAFSKNPFLGTGYSSITLATDNDYLRFLGEVGLLGFFSFVLIILRITLELAKKLPDLKKYTALEVGLLAGLLGAFPGLAINAVFIDIFEASKFAILFWLLVGFAIGVVRVNGLGKNENLR